MAFPMTTPTPPTAIPGSFPGVSVMTSGAAPTATPAVGGWGENLALGLGVGALGMSALGRTSTGVAPSAKIPLTAAGKKLETSLYKSIKTELFPENLASRFIGQAKKIEQARRRVSGRLFQGATATGPDRAISGDVARAFLTETRERYKGAQEGPRQLSEAKRKFALNRLTKLQNFINLQTQTPVLRAEADLINQELAQMRGAQRGAAYCSASCYELCL